MTEAETPFERLAPHEAVERGLVDTAEIRLDSSGDVNAYHAGTQTWWRHPDQDAELKVRLLEALPDGEQRAMLLEALPPEVVKQMTASVDGALGSPGDHDDAYEPTLAGRLEAVLGTVVERLEALPEVEPDPEAREKDQGMALLDDLSTRQSLTQQAADLASAIKDLREPVLLSSELGTTTKVENHFGPPPAPDPSAVEQFVTRAWHVCQEVEVTRQEIEASTSTTKGGVRPSTGYADRLASRLREDLRQQQ